MELSVGQKASRTVTLTSEHVKLYAELTGDQNPLHFDEDFAAKTKFGKLVVQGGLTTGVLHALVAMDMPGPGTVFINQQWTFPRPVYIGDTIRAEARVISVHSRRPQADLSFEVANQSGREVLRGEATLDGNDIFREHNGIGDRDLGNPAINVLAKLPWRSVVTADRWKLNLCAGDQCELFDLRSDPHEMSNLVDDARQRDRVRDLAARIRLWQHRTGDAAPLPAV
ncbi:MAG: MaoC family dehydratase N-terminal domain-containing protein [Candidatus Marinimicrobia bacterium]|nr:MaoC family dehydratase N-terminal domain-containing protein [Candidatus Neomarinimicrobiota bacterium]